MGTKAQRCVKMNFIILSLQVLVLKLLPELLPASEGTTSLYATLQALGDVFQWAGVDHVVASVDQLPRQRHIVRRVASSVVSQVRHTSTATSGDVLHCLGCFRNPLELTILRFLRDHLLFLILDVRHVPPTLRQQ